MVCLIWQGCTPHIGLSHIEVLTSPSCPHCLAEVKMVLKVANSLSDVFATETSVATPESYNKAKSHRVIVVPPIHINDILPFVGQP